MPTPDEILKKLTEKEEQALHGDAKAVEKQHAEGKLTARERIAALLDPGSFVEEFMLAETTVREFGMAEKKGPGDGVVVGHGRIDGRPVYIFAQDRTVLAGTVGAVHAEKIAYAVETARRIGVPVIGLHDSPGARIQEGLEMTRAIGTIFHQNTQASGVIPQVAAILGPCIGVSAYSPALMDFVLMAKGTSQMFITGPPVIKEVLGEEVTMEELGGAKVHSEISGVADLVAKSDEDCLSQVRTLIGFLPLNCRERPPRRETGDDPRRLLPDIASAVPQQMRKPYDITKLIGRIVDGGEFFEIKPRFARNLVVGFGRLDGWTVGWVANNPMFLAGSLDIDASDKAARFIRFCDAFNIPIVTLVDVPGFFPGTKQERGGIIRHGAKMLYAYSEATVPKITLYIRKGYGGAKQAMCTREMGADQVLLWPGVELAVMGAAAAVDVLYRREIEKAEDPAEFRRKRIAEFEGRFSGPFDGVATQFAQGAIRPEETRLRLIELLQMFEGKREEQPAKKHGTMPV